VCQVDFGQVHLDATIPARRDDAFFGTLTIEEKIAIDQDPRCPSRCTLWVEHDAVLNRATPR